MCFLTKKMYLKVCHKASFASVLCLFLNSEEICAMEKKIFLKDVLLDMKKLDNQKNPIAFSLAVRSFNKQNNTGGKLIVYHNVTLMQTAKIKKSVANHWENRTRNIKLPNGEIKKINILFIVSYNGKEVIY